MFMTKTHYSSVKTYLHLVCYLYWIIYFTLLRIMESICSSHVYVFYMLYISFPVTWEMNVNNQKEFDLGKWLLKKGCYL